MCRFSEYERGDAALIKEVVADCYNCKTRVTMYDVQTFYAGHIYYADIDVIYDQAYYLAPIACPVCHQIWRCTLVPCDDPAVRFEMLDLALEA